MKFLCSDCIGEVYLKGIATSKGRMNSCSYCGSKGTVLELEQLTDMFEQLFEDHFIQTPRDASGFEYAMGGNWEREGELAVDVIADQGDVGEEVAKDIFESLRDRHFDRERAEIGEEGPFDEETQYAEAPVDSAKYDAAWSHFEKTLRAKARYYSPETQETLTSIFGGVDGHKTFHGQSVIIRIGPKTELPILFRARVFQSGKKLIQALKRPDLQLGPPPWDVATPGRMNARGISVFYGATDSKTALAETRPPVGSRVLVGRFKVIRPLNLLDLGKFKSIGVKGSLFDPGYKDQLEKTAFLKSLSERMTAPVMPDDEPFEYLATQVISEFLATVPNPPLDGILYPSSQEAGKESNVVLFHKSSRVQELDIPHGTRIEANLYHMYEDGADEDYSVYEEVPSQPSTQPVVASVKEVDERDPALELDTSSLEVHGVRTVNFTTHSDLVRRTRIKSPTPVPKAKLEDWP